MASLHTGLPVQRAAISVPCSFNITERQALLGASKAAGFTSTAFITDGTAAGLTYGFDRKKLDRAEILVVDVGRLSTDVTLVQVSSEGIYEVLATVGSLELGGE